MDPFAAISLVGNILQFVVYAKDCYIQVKEIQASVTGLTKRNDEIVDSSHRMDAILESISAGIGSRKNGSMTTTQRQILEVAGKCQRLATELREDIGSMAVRNRSSVFRAATNVFRGVWKMSEVDQKLRELANLQSDVFRLLLAHISHQQSGVGMALAKLMDQNRQLEMTRMDNLEQFKSEILAVLPKKDSPQPSAESVKEISSKLSQWAERADSLKKSQAILRSLRFDGMLRRREEIPDAQPRTFEWIQKPELSFLEWLSKDDGVYWVTGDPGSGKSTLMKYLSNHDLTHEKLVQWAGQKQLVKASFYFWFTGAVLQRSQEGLLRSLLFEILRQCPSLIPVVCHSRWTSDLTDPWTRGELMQTLKSLSLETTSTRFFFLIDGLDEYQGDHDVSASSEGGMAGHVKEIIEAMDILSGLKDIKLCLSSRPWPDFEKAFGQLAHRKLYVHNENRDDIRHYIREKFERSVDFTESTTDREELQKLVESMVEDSRGVFLWVFLAVESLLRGLSNQDRVAELRRRLDETPKRLHEMFERMLASVEKVYQEQAAKILQIALYAREPMYVVVYSLVGDDEDDDLNALVSERGPWSEEECVALSKTAEHRLKVRCPDLIKVRGCADTVTTAQKMTTHRVEFLHRTVRDFLSLDETQAMLRQRMKKPFDASAFIARALLIQIKGAQTLGQQTWSVAEEGKEMWQLLNDITFYVRELEQRLHVPQTMLLDQLEETISEQIGERDSLLGRDSFTSIMAQKELLLYVETKLPQALNGPGFPLLDSVLFPRWPQPEKRANNFPDPSLEMVQLLLQHGARWNQFAENGRTSIWDNYMRRLFEARAELSSNQDLRKTHISIIQSLLEKGADPRLRCLVGSTDPKPTVGKGKGVSYPKYKDIIAILEEIFTTEEREFVELLIYDRRGGFFSKRGLAGWLGFVN